MTDEKCKALDTQVGGDHYKGMAIQPFEYIHANGIGFAEGCAIKYLSRWRVKGGVEDLRKARHFVDMLIEAETPTAEPEPLAPEDWQDGTVPVSEWLAPEPVASEPVTLNADEMAMVAGQRHITAIAALRVRRFGATGVSMPLSDAKAIVYAYRASIKASEPPPVKRDHEPTWCVYHGGLVRHRRDVIDTTWGHYHSIRRTFTTRAAAREFARKEREDAK